MVWESGCVVVVMLTPLSENGVKQCHRYWPDEGSDIYHVYEVGRREIAREGVSLYRCLKPLVRSVLLRSIWCRSTSGARTSWFGAST